jgi:hypothetical protein
MYPFATIPLLGIEEALYSPQSRVHTRIYRRDKDELSSSPADRTTPNFLLPAFRPVMKGRIIDDVDT